MRKCLLYHALDEVTDDNGDCRCSTKDNHTGEGWVAILTLHNTRVEVEAQVAEGTLDNMSGKEGLEEMVEASGGVELDGTQF